MKIGCIHGKVFSALFLLITMLVNETQGQSDVQGIWSGTVRMKIISTTDLPGMTGTGTLEIITTFNENRGSGIMKFEGEWSSSSGTRKTTCNGTGNAELYHLDISNDYDTSEIYSYYIHVIGPEYSCSPVEDGPGGDGRDITISDKVTAKYRPNALSGIQTNTVDNGAGKVTTILSWDLQQNPPEVELIVTPDGTDKNGVRKSYDDWLPEPGRDELTKGSVLNISLKLQGKNGKPLQKKAKAFELRLSNTSTEPGITINYPVSPQANQLPDLRFLPLLRGESIKEDQFISIPCYNGSTGEMKIASYDGGGWTVLNVEAILTDNTRVQGRLLVSDGETDIRIPKREPNSKIAERWLKENGNPDEMDDDEVSKGNSNDGDGLTAYEEYRGVIAEGKYKRFDPTKKEIGIQAEQRDFALFAEGISWFKSASNLEVIRFDFDRNEIAGDGRLNVNAKSAHDYDQYTLYLLNGGLGGGTLGIVYSKTNEPDIPAQIISVVADWTKIQAAYQSRVTRTRPDLLKFTLKDYLAQTVAHELGHAVDIWHHGDSRTYDDWTVNDLSNSNRIFDRNGNPNTTRPITLINIGYKTGTVESGDISCMLNYYPYFKWGYSVGIDGANIFNEEPLLPLGKIFCKSKIGTGINATQLYFGDAAATNGNCLGQIKLRN